MGHILGCELGTATVDPHTADGKVDLGSPAEDTLRNTLLLLAAGAQGAEMSGVEQQHKNELMGDMARAVDLLERAFPDDEAAQDRERSAAFGQCAALLNDRAPRVRRVAEALLNAPGFTLCGSELISVLEADG